MQYLWIFGVLLVHCFSALLVCSWSVIAALLVCYWCLVLVLFGPLLLRYPCDVLFFLLDGDGQFAIAAPCGDLWWHTWKWDDWGLSGPRAGETAEKQRQCQIVHLSHHGAVQPMCYQRVQEIHRQRPQPLFYQCRPQVRVASWHSASNTYVLLTNE